MYVAWYDFTTICQFLPDPRTSKIEPQEQNSIIHKQRNYLKYHKSDPGGIMQQQQLFCRAYVNHPQTGILYIRMGYLVPVLRMGYICPRSVAATLVSE